MLICMDTYTDISQIAPSIITRSQNGNGDTFYTPQNSDKADDTTFTP